jgi:UDP-glucose 4-epimerase
MGKADGCFHLAAIASVPACHEDPVGTHGVNQTGTLIVLEAARRAGGVPVVYASSAAVYGEAVECPISEGVVSSPLSTYGADKLACELHAAVMSRQHGVPTLGFRFFNVYGPRQDPNSPYSGVISIFCDRARRGYPIVIHGDGRQTRDFVHVSDVVRQLAEAIARIELSPDIFNLCSGTSTSVSELAQRITSALGVRPRIVHDQPRTGDIRASVGDPSRVRQTFGFLPRISLSEGLAGLVSARPRVA